jgi:hypothetical protein
MTLDFEGDGLYRLRKKSLLRVDSGPQRLKPDLFSIRYVRAKARTLQLPEFFSSLFNQLEGKRVSEHKLCESLRG